MHALKLMSDHDNLLCYSFIMICLFEGRFMRFLIKFWKRVLYFIVTGSTSVFIAACYGMPVNFNHLGNWTIKVKDTDNNPIEGLEVKILQYREGVSTPDTIDVQKSDSLGESTHELYSWDDDVNYRHEALIVDIDSLSNGGFYNDTIIKFDDSDTTIVNMREKDDNNS